MTTVPIVYKGRTKLVSVSLDDFGELEQKVRGKFPDIPDGKIEIKAQVKDGDGTKYNVDDDEDLQLVKNQLERLHIRCLSEGTEAAVVVAGANYSIDQIPSPDSPIVRAMIEEFETDVDNIDAVSLDTRLGNLRYVVELFQLAATAGNIRGANLHDLEVGSYNTNVFLVKLCNDVDVYYTRCTSTCKSVLDTVMVAAGFHLDGFDDMALKELAKLGEVSSRMALHCQDLVEKVVVGVARVEDLQRDVAGNVKVQEDNKDVLEQLPIEIEKKNLDFSVKRANLEESMAGAEQRHGNSAQVRDSLSKATKGAGGLAAAVTAAVGAGIQAGALTMTMPVVGVPLAILTATGALLFACHKQTSDMNAQQVADEATLAEKRREEADSKKELLDLTHKLEQMNEMDIDHVLDCLYQVNGQLKKLHSTLFAWKTFWEKLATIFFPRQQETEQRFVDYTKEDIEKQHALFSGKGFKQMLIKYLARWVAFQEHCKESQASIQVLIGPLHQLMERNLTAGEARAELRKRAQAIGEKLAIDG